MQPKTSPKIEPDAERAKPATRVSIAAGLAPLVVLGGIAVSSRPFLPAWGFMWALAAAIFFGLKWLSGWRGRSEGVRAAFSDALGLGVRENCGGNIAFVFMRADGAGTFAAFTRLGRIAGTDSGAA